MSLNNGKKLYQPWNEDEFNADHMVGCMTSTQRWMYRTLCQRAWVCSTRPYLPFDDDELWILAGCESKEQWLQNKAVVLKMFSTGEQNGQQVLSRKRIIQDWERESKRKETISAQQKERAMKRWYAPASPPHPDGMPTECRNMPTELNRTEQNRTEQNHEPNRTVRQREADPIEKIPKLCRNITGLLPERLDGLQNPTRDSLEALAEAYGGDKVIEHFELWAKEHEGEAFTFPIQAFIKEADGRLRGIIVTDNSALDSLAAELYDIGQKEFAADKRKGLYRLLRDYPADEIIAAYKEFIEHKTDFEMNFVTRDFVQGGAVSVILSRRKREQEHLKLKAQMAEERRLMELEAANEPMPQEEPMAPDTL